MLCANESFNATIHMIQTESKYANAAIDNTDKVLQDIRVYSKI